MSKGAHLLSGKLKTWRVRHWMFGSSLPPVFACLFYIICVSAYSDVRILDGIYAKHSRRLIRGRNCLPFPSNWVHPSFWWGPCCFFSVFLCCPIMCLYVMISVLWCQLWFPHKMMLGSSLPPVVMYYLRYLCLLAHSGVQHIVLCFFSFFLRLMYPMLPVYLHYPFLFGPSIFSNAYLYTTTTKKFWTIDNSSICPLNVDKQ